MQCSQQQVVFDARALCALARMEVIKPRNPRFQSTSRPWTLVRFQAIAIFTYTFLSILLLLTTWQIIRACQSSQLRPHRFGAQPSLCPSLPRISQACSHKGIGNLTPGKPLLEGLYELWTSGVTCFDLDSVQTLDGFLVVGHPSQIKASLDIEKLPGEKLPETSSLMQLRAAGLAELQFPLLDDVMLLFHNMTSGQIFYRDPLESRHWIGFPVLSVELKSAAVNKHALSYIVERARRLGISQYLLLWFREEAERNPALLAHYVKKLRSYAMVGLVVPDSFGADGTGDGDGSWPSLTKEDLVPYDFLAPSIRLPEPFLRQVLLWKPCMLWILDTDDQRSKAFQLGADLGVSNQPLEYHRMAVSLTDRCTKR